MTDNPASPSRDLSVARRQSIALRRNALVTRGLEDIARVAQQRELLDRGRELLERARAFYESRDYDSAIRHYREAIRLNPSNEAAYCCSKFAHPGENPQRDTDAWKRLAAMVGPCQCGGVADECPMCNRLLMFYYGEKAAFKHIYSSEYLIV